MSSNGERWLGRILGGLPLAFLLVDALGKLLELPPVLEGTAGLGFRPSAAFDLGVVELVCAVVYAIPRTSVLGAILLTGYLGGATASHVRLDQPYWFPVLVGVAIWAGLAVRDHRLRAVL